MYVCGDALVSVLYCIECMAAPFIVDRIEPMHWQMEVNIWICHDVIMYPIKLIRCYLGSIQHFYKTKIYSIAETPSDQSGIYIFDLCLLFGTLAIR